ncbi:MAG: hypothetical protein HYX99_02455, partial [Chloroflexi bacterium]|nr:hypothetical protein [Chloroflexota bacterium]
MVIGEGGYAPLTPLFGPPTIDGKQLNAIRNTVALGSRDLSSTSDEIRELFLRFFEERGHLRLPSSSLVPAGDPTLLLTTAGMVQIKPYFTGEAVPPSPRLASCQKCFRTTDIDSVGDDKHLTFFEMLGNFSVGDYFKKEAIQWAWEFVTRALSLPKEKLWITVFLDDDEAFAHWKALGVPESRILRYGEKDNFWGPAGDSGPCGPSSEIHYDWGEEYGCGPDCEPAHPCGRFLEIWNLVFTQFDQDMDGKRIPMPQPNIDTGMGLERAVSVVAGQHPSAGSAFVPSSGRGGRVSFYDTEIFQPLLRLVSKLSGVPNGRDAKSDRALRIVAEHSRGIAFLLADGVVPSNEGRGYVLRRVLRRAVRYGRLLGLKEPFLAKVAEAVIGQMGHAYPELVRQQEFVLRLVEHEEASFHNTVAVGSGVLEGTIVELRRQLREYFPTFKAAFRNALSERPINHLLNAVSLAVEDFRRDCRAWEGMLLVSGRNVIEEDLRPVDEALGGLKNMVQMRDTGPHEPIEVFKLRLNEQFKGVEATVRAVAEKVSGLATFVLFDTYGFPAELTEEIAK